MQSTNNSAWILDSLFKGSLRRYRPVASLVLGLAAPALFAVISCAGSGAIGVMLASSIHLGQQTVTSLLAFFSISGSLVASIFVMQLLASSQLPLSIRLAMIYGMIFACWNAALWFTDETINPLYLLCTIPLCLGGFFQRRFVGWRALGWNQKVHDSRITIASMLDITTAIALTLALVTATGNIDPRGLLCFIPTAMAFALLGMHAWTRLTSLCPIRHHAENGFGIWMAVNVVFAILVFITFAVSYNSTPAALVGFIAAPGALLVVHVWTEVPLRWLRACGWTFIRLDERQQSMSAIPKST